LDGKQGMEYVLDVQIYDSLRSQADIPMAHPDVVDALLQGIMASQSSLEEFKLYGCCSARVIRQFIERFPTLERLDIDGQRRPDSGPGNADTRAFDDFAVALAVALRKGKLPSLTKLWIDSNVGSTAFVALLSAVESSSTVSTITLSVLNRSREFLPYGFAFVAGSLPDTVKTASVRANPDEELLDISSLFPVGGGYEAFAPSLTNVELSRCKAGDDDYDTGAVDPFLFDRAAAALAHVETLGLFQCRLPPLALEMLLVKLPRLTSFFCLSRARSILGVDTLDNEFDDAPYVLGTDAALAKLC
jgi:hypothetical protein